LTAPDISLTGKVAIITGGGAGIGRAIALSYASVGAKLVIVDKIAERGVEVVARVAELGGEAIAIPCDVTDTAQIDAMVGGAHNHFGRIDILVNNVGGVAPKRFKDQSETAWRRIIDLNLISVLATTSAVIPHMIESKAGGVIVNVSSIEGSRAAPNYAVYGACKAGLLNLTRSLALELAEYNIRVNAIAPDYTVTPGLRGNVTGPVDPSSWQQPSEAHLEATARRIPLGRPGVDSECGSVAVFLSSKMSEYVTGTVIPVDGGSWASSGWLRNKAGEWTLTGDM